MSIAARRRPSAATRRAISCSVSIAEALAVSAALARRVVSGSRGQANSCSRLQSMSALAESQSISTARKRGEQAINKGARADEDRAPGHRRPTSVRWLLRTSRDTRPDAAAWTTAARTAWSPPESSAARLAKASCRDCADPFITRALSAHRSSGTTRASFRRAGNPGRRSPGFSRTRRDRGCRG